MGSVVTYNCLKIYQSYTLFTQSRNYLDCDLDRNPENVSVYKGHSLFNTQDKISRSISRSG